MTESQLFDYEGRARAVREAYERWRTPGKPLKKSLTKQQRATRMATRTREYAEGLAAWSTALEQAYPPGFWVDYARLRRHDPAGIEAAIQFLEADPWFFRTGYLKAELLRYLGQVPLDSSQQHRLREVMIVTVKGRDRREFRHYCRLARKIDAPELRSALDELIQATDSNVRRRADWMRHFCEHGRWST